MANTKFSEPRIYKDKANKKWCIRFNLFKDGETYYYKEYGKSYGIKLNHVVDLSERQLILGQLLLLVKNDLDKGIIPGEREKIDREEQEKKVYEERFYHFDNVLKFSMQHRGYDNPRPNQMNSKESLNSFWTNQFRPFVERIGKLSDIRGITIDDIEAFLEEQSKPHSRITKTGKTIKVKGWSDKTINDRISWIGMLFSPLVKKRKLSINPAHKIARRSEIRVDERGSNLIRFQVYSKQELEILWNFLQSRPYYHAAAKTVYFCFIRPSELLRIRLWMVDLKNNKILLPEWLSKNGKSVKKTQEVYIPPALKIVLEQHLHATFKEDLNPDYYLFPGHDKGSKRIKPLQQRGVGTLSKIFTYFLEILRSEHKNLFPSNKTLYSLKHTGNTNFIENNYANKSKSALHILTFLRKQNRHASLNETQKYISEDLGIILEEIENAFVFD